MAVAEELARAVRARAQQRCQYCRMHEILQGATFHIKHVVPQSKGGASALENLALACPGCNLRKASKVLAVDPETGDWVPLFHPIRGGWAEHFRFNRYEKPSDSSRRFPETFRPDRAVVSPVRFAGDRPRSGDASPNPVSRERGCHSLPCTRTGATLRTSSGPHHQPTKVHQCRFRPWEGDTARFSWCR